MKSIPPGKLLGVAIILFFMAFVWGVYVSLMNEKPPEYATVIDGIHLDQPAPPED